MDKEILKIIKNSAIIIDKVWGKGLKKARNDFLWAFNNTDAVLTWAVAVEILDFDHGVIISTDDLEAGRIPDDLKNMDEQMEEYGAEQQAKIKAIKFNFEFLH